MKNIIFTGIISLLLFACGNEQIKNTSKDSLFEETNSINENVVTLTEEQMKNGGIETGKASLQNISSVLKLNGKIDVTPQSLISISVPLGGYIKSTKLLNGMEINKGEVLAVLEGPQYIELQQDYLTAKALFALTESDYIRQKELNQSKSTSDKVFEQSKANYQSQLINIKSLEEKLKLIGLIPHKLTTENISKSINIYSPIKGFVSSVNVNIGKYVTQNEVLFELINPSDIHLTLSVFEKDVNKLAIGQKLLAYSNSNPQKKYPCKIVLISKKFSENNNLDVHCHFAQLDNSLFPGMFLNALIELNENQNYALNDEALVRFDNKYYVFEAIEKNKFQILEVQVGNRENGKTEILSKNFSEKTFVLKGAYNLLMTLKNKI